MRHKLDLPAALFLLFTGFYLLTLSGHLYSADEETMYLVTRGIALSGDVAIVAPPGSPIAALRPGADGRGYAPYGILPSLLALPLFGLGALAAPLGPAAFDYTTRFAVSALNAPLTAATAALLAAWALRLGASRRAAAALALCYALGSFAWVYSRTFFSEPLAALLLLIAAERADAAWRTRTAGPLLVAGLATGLLLATRIASGVALPLLGLFVLATQAVAGGATFSLRRAVGGVVWWSLGLLPGLGLVAGYNLLRFGTPLATGYASESALFTTPLTEGLYGLLLSRDKSLFLYAPPLLLALPGALRLWRRERAVVLLALSLTLAHLLLYAGWGEWAGGGVWGPRFLLPIVPLLLLLAVGLAGAPRSRQTGAAFVGVGGLLFGLGFVANLGGALVNFNTYLNMPRPSVPETPPVAHWRIFADRVGRYAPGEPHCALGAGLFAPEGPTEAPLPRRSGAQANIVCTFATPALITLALDDRRPPQAPASDLDLHLNGRSLGALPAGQTRRYQLLLPAGRADLELRALPWNPRRVGFSDRDDELGVLVQSLQAQARHGAALPLIDRAIAPLPERPRPRWAWYYDPPNQHLVDHWAWYLPRSELPGWAAGLTALLLAGVAGGCLTAGVLLVRR